MFSQSLLRFLHQVHSALWRWRHLVEQRYPKLQSMTIELTSSCNLACPHCCMDAARAGAGHEISREALVQFMGKVKKTFGTGVFLTLTGGEPLMHSQALEVLADLKAQGFVLGLITNGALITERNISALSAALSSVSVSVDGLAAAHDLRRGAGSFDRAMHALQLLSAARIPQLMVNSAVHEGNLPKQFLSGTARSVRENYEGRKTGPTELRWSLTAATGLK